MLKVRFLQYGNFHSSHISHIKLTTNYSHKSFAVFAFFDEMRTIKVLFVKITSKALLIDFLFRFKKVFFCPSFDVNSNEMTK